MNQVSPDESINSYDPSSRWDSTKDNRLYLMELAAAKTGDGLDLRSLANAS